MSRREILAPIIASSEWDRPNLEPATPLQALMEAGIHEPLLSQEERLPIREAILECLEKLDPEELELMEAHFFEGLGCRLLARRYGTSRMTMWRRLHPVVDKLRGLLLENATVQERLGYPPLGD
jgi:DNA-directed RNA polymerase specialized sigma24 family protein